MWPHFNLTLHILCYARISETPTKCTILYNSHSCVHVSTLLDLVGVWIIKRCAFSWCFIYLCNPVHGLAAYKLCYAFSACIMCSSAIGTFKCHNLHDNSSNIHYPQQLFLIKTATISIPVTTCKTTIFRLHNLWRGDYDCLAARYFVTWHEENFVKVIYAQDQSRKSVKSKRGKVT
jgi:hypothetical protein